MRFGGKTVLVTGAGAGIGRAAGLQFASEGAHVIATDRDVASLSDLIGCETHRLDVTDPAGIEALASETGPIDILFNCAGYVATGTVLQTTIADWERSFSINVTAAFSMIRAFLPGMVERKRGVVINMASVVSSVKGLPNRFAYGASKAALIGITKSIAADYVGQGIRCNAICPGTVDTPSLHDRLRATEDYANSLKAFISRQPMGRLATAHEIAALVLYLASDDAAFLTGQAICIDGGIST